MGISPHLNTLECQVTNFMEDEQNHYKLSGVQTFNHKSPQMFHSEVHHAFVLMSHFMAASSQ